MADTSRWMMNVHGDRLNHFEISIVRENNEHGRRSYGWFDKRKRPVADNVHMNGPKDKFFISEELWNGLLVLADAEARRLNAKEGIDDFDDELPDFD